MRSRAQGFTLIEVLVAVTITALLLMTVYGVFSSVSGTRDRLEKRGEGFHQARVIFDRIGREIRSAYTVQGPAQAVISGGLNKDGRPYLHLATTATTPQGGVTTGVAVVEYELQDDPEVSGEKILMRSEYPLLTAEDERPRGYRLATGLKDFRLRFFTQGEWKDEWTEGLPLLIEVSLSILLDGREVPFRSSFEVSPIAKSVL